MTAFLLAHWPELTGVAVVLAASWFVVWAFNGSLLPSLILGVPFGCGVGMGVAAVTGRRKP